MSTMVREKDDVKRHRADHDFSSLFQVPSIQPRTLPLLSSQLGSALQLSIPRVAVV